MVSSSLVRARQRLTTGDVGGARRDAEALLATAPGEAESAAAHLILAACSEKSRDLAAALTHARAAVALTPRDPVARYALAEIEEATGDTLGAVASLRRATELNPRFVQAHHYLGILLGESDDPQGALAAFTETVRLDPGHARGWNNLGNSQRTLGRLAEAAQSFACALAIKPDYQLAAANLGGVQRDLGKVEQAEATLRAALARATGARTFRPLLVLLAGLLRERAALDEAEQLYVRAIEAAPSESGGEWFNLGWVYTERGEPERAREAYAWAQAVDASDLRSLLARHLTLPMIYWDAEALRAARAAFGAGLDALNRELNNALGNLPEAKLLDGLRWTNFFLAYQGLDDRSLQRAYATLVAGAIDKIAARWRTPIAPRPLTGRRIRVGFASAFFHVGTCGRYFKSWITDLDRDRFEVFIYHLWPGMDEIASAIERRADCFRTFGGSRSRPSVVAPVIRADDLDVLIYTELGMDVTSFALAALRLAPRQYAAWGHPMTTGHTTIDAFFSCDSMEPDGADAHYTEKLVKLPGIGTRYERPPLPAAATRAQIGLPAEGTLLLCPQSLFKIHPDNDALFAEVLSRNPHAMLVLIAGRHPAITDQFMRRLGRVFDRQALAVQERTRLIAQVGHDDYLRLNLVCDAMLDTLHWSGGNSSLDALACGLPIVTLPGAFMRGRQSAGMLSLMGLTELIARDRDDYLAIATRLVAEPAWRRDLARRIRAAHGRLFDVNDAVLRLQALLQLDDMRAA